jgi:WD40 repeat protein
MLRTLLGFLFICCGINSIAQTNKIDVVLQIGHSAKINSLIFTSNGKYFITCSNDHTVKIWNVSTGKAWTIRDDENIVEDIAISPDDKYLVYTVGECIKIYDFKTRVQITEFREKNQNFNSIRFLPNGDLITSNVTDFIILNGNSFEEKKRIPHPFGVISLLEVNPINNQLAAVVEKFKVDIYSINDFSIIHKFDLGPGSVKRVSELGQTIQDIKFSPDGKLLATSTYSGQIGIFDLKAKKLKVWEEDISYIDRISFSYDSKTLFYATQKIIKAKETQLGKTLFEILGHSSSISALASNPSGDFIATAYAGDIRGDNDYSVKFWSANDGHFVKSYELTGYQPIDAQFINGTNKIIIHREDDSFFEFDLDRLNLKQISSGKKTNIERACFSPQSAILTIARLDGSVELIDVVSNKIVKRIDVLKGKTIYRLLYEKNKKLLIATYFKTGSENMELSVVDTETDKINITTEIGKINAISVSNSGESIAVSEGEAIGIYGTDLSLIKTIPCAEAKSSELSFSDNDKYIAVGFTKGESIAALYNIQAGIQKTAVNAKGLRNSRFSYSNKKAMSVPVPQKKELLAAGNFSDYSIRVYNTLTSEEVKRFVGHVADIVSISLSPDGSILISTSNDGTIKIWDYNSGVELATLATFGNEGFVVYTPSGYYRASKDAVGGIAFNFNGELLPFEQLDLHYNRPDIMLAAISPTNITTRNAYQKAWQKRVQKMGFKSISPDKEINIPEVSIQGIENLGMATNQKKLNFRVTASDKLSNINRINVLVNNVPVYGLKGYSVSSKMAKNIEQDFAIDLSNGANKITISAHNADGFESIKHTFELTYDGPKSTQNLYIVAIGVSEYLDTEYNLRYAAKDARDVINKFKSPNANFSDTKIVEITNALATKENIRKVKEVLLNTNVDDEVLLFVAVHGLLDENLDYYIATHNIDFNNPSGKGLLYDDLEGLLDGIPARRKLMLIDACHSGEVDKDESLTLAYSENMVGNVTARGFKTIKNSDSQMGIGNSFELMKELFADLRQGTGAMVISSAGGAEFAFESSEWKNGVFTFSVLEGIRTGNADANKDGEIRVSELRDYVFARVKELTQGKQNPTSRQENLEFDFRVW